MKEIKRPPMVNNMQVPSAVPCPVCKSPMTHGPVACPDGKPGCCVLHYGYTCQGCGRQFQ